ncbi:flagellar basal-body rod protein FlgF [Loktanella ponticola]|uniref:Flagellar basal-body rod protein FlgF n=1 Tax=Yoonia ponticola TaxID=1524255 RepID=A0A7W9EY29_9RHOB|nr:flagellar hook-basal body complex protein [Yoonia ponticola]MBB5722317.1 flagellar basal-body rod protein FlgF [Yoonia ponticola]
MDNATYTALTRQSGLANEMRVVANNIANASTTGFRAEGVIFSEYVNALGNDHDSLSMATARVRDTMEAQGALKQTNATFDLAIEGDGFFLIQTPNGERLTRAGHFTPNQNGDLVTADGFPVLDAGGAPVFVPTGAGPVVIGADGVVSAGGQLVGQVGLVVPNNPQGLTREGGTRFVAPDGFDVAPDARVVQGFLEGSNVNPTLEIARMIEVQRAYELGQSFLDKEDERIRAVMQAMGR